MASERREFAKTLRKHQTRPEQTLWERLRGSRFHGAKFRRQVPFDRFVVDFYCHAAKLVIELDGQQHEWFSDYDAGRTEILERLGLRIVRFTNEEVSDDLDSVLARIRAELRLPFD
jgi:very-short-patch-repair endonuclease